MRVYPPGRSLYRGAMDSTSFFTAPSLLYKLANRTRLFASVGDFARVIIFSTFGRSSLAFASVVWMRSRVMSEVTRPFISATRWFLVRLNVLLALWCLMLFLKR